MADTYAFMFDPDYPDDPFECDNCGSVAQLGAFDWGPPYTAPHERPKQLLCEYCANVTSKESDECRHLAQMFNVLERRLRQAPPPKGGCQCPACRVAPHSSDCAVHNAPAYPPGPCDCGAVPR